MADMSKWRSSRSNEHGNMSSSTIFNGDFSALHTVTPNEIEFRESSLQSGAP